MSKIKTIDDLDVAGKRVLVRADLNVPMRDGKITDTTRIDRTAPTLKELADKGAKVVVMCHFGRPKGERVADLTLAPVAAELGRIMGVDVAFADDCIGDGAASVVNAMKDGDIAMLENLRYHKGETDNDAGFAADLAKLGDAYVDDAFSCSHRAHASTEGVAKILPAAAGRLMQAELEALGAALDAPKRPVAAVVGGAKVSTKLEVLENLSSKVDVLVIGGGMANTFLHAQGVDIGKSLCEKDMADTARRIMDGAAAKNCEIILPVDGVVAWEFAANTKNETVTNDAIPSDGMVLDAGPATVEAVNAKLATCKTVVWNGPMGAFEIAPFDMATNAVAQQAARLTKSGDMVSVAGGGDTVAALEHAGAKDDFTYISTAGGAFLEWLEGKTLPGVEVLMK